MASNRHARPSRTGRGTFLNPLADSWLSPRMDNQGKTIEVTEQNFETVVGDGIVLLDFWASWCAPCRMFGPIFEEAAAKHTDIKFGKVNTEEQRNLAASFGVSAIPTWMVLRDRVLLAQSAGVVPNNVLDDIIEQVRKLDMDEVRASIAAQDNKRNPGVNQCVEQLPVASVADQAGPAAGPMSSRCSVMCPATSVASARARAAACSRSSSAASQRGWRGSQLPSRPPHVLRLSARLHRDVAPHGSRHLRRAASSPRGWCSRRGSWAGAAGVRCCRCVAA